MYTTYVKTRRETRVSAYTNPSVKQYSITSSLPSQAHYVVYRISASAAMFSALRVVYQGV